jgi:hypothetical protein
VRDLIEVPLRDKETYYDDIAEPYPTVIDQDIVMLQDTGEGEIKNVNRGDGRRLAVKRNGVFADLVTVNGDKIILENDTDAIEI